MIRTKLGQNHTGFCIWYPVSGSGIRPNPVSGFRIQKISVVLSQLSSDLLNQLVGEVNVIELPCCCLLFTYNNRDKLEIEIKLSLYPSSL